MIFISYRSIENDKALFIRHLCEANGIECWKAPEDIHPGKDYSASIPDAIDNCSALVIVLTEEAQKSKWILREITDAENKNKRVIPIRMDNSSINNSFGFMLNHTHFIEAYGREEKAYEDLVRELWIIEGMEQKARVMIPGLAVLPNPIPRMPDPPIPVPPKPDRPKPIPPKPLPSKRKWLVIALAAILIAGIALAGFMLLRPEDGLQMKYEKGALTLTWPKDDNVSKWEIRYDNGLGVLAQYIEGPVTTAQYFSVQDQINLSVAVMPQDEAERTAHNMYSASFIFPEIIPYTGNVVEVKEFQLLWHDRSDWNVSVPLQSGVEMDQTKYELALHHTFSIAGVKDGETIHYMSALETPSGARYETGGKSHVSQSSFGKTAVSYGGLINSSIDLHGEYKLHLYINGMYWGYESLILE